MFLYLFHKLFPCITLDRKSWQGGGTARRRPKIKIEVTDCRGKHGCHRGHKVGEVFDFDEDRGKICPMAMHCAFPYIDILRYGGKIPGQPEGTAEFCCSDADTIMVFRAEIVPEEDE